MGFLVSVLGGGGCGGGGWENIFLFFEGFYGILEVSFELVDLLDGLAKFSVEGFVFFYLLGYDVDEIGCPGWESMIWIGVRFCYNG